MNVMGEQCSILPIVPNATLKIGQILHVLAVLDYNYLQINATLSLR